MQFWQIMLLYLLGFLVLLYFTTILPGKRKHKKMQELHDSIAVGDEVSTIGGIIGTVVERSGDVVTIRIDEQAQVNMRVVIYAIQSILSKA